MSTITDIENRAMLMNKNYSGIFPPYEVFYLHSIHYSSNRCLSFFEQYTLLKEVDKTPPDVLISLVQEAIGHAAALSRYFWPSRENNKNKKNQSLLKENRGRQLRELCGLTDKSALHNRDLRNAWEHFDERLDSYLLEHITGELVPDCIIGSHSTINDPTMHVFKLLDPEEDCLVLLNQKFFFRPIRTEVSTIFEITSNAIIKGTRLR